MVVVTDTATPHDGSVMDLLIVSAGVVLGGTGLTGIILPALIETDLTAVYGNEIMGNVFWEMIVGVFSFY